MARGIRKKKDKISEKRKFRKFAIGKARVFLLWVIYKKGPIHGYGIIKLLKDEGIPIAEASRIYPFLNGFEKEGLVRSKRILLDKRATKTYEITKKGERKMREERDGMPNIVKQFSKEVLCS